MKYHENFRDLIREIVNSNQGISVYEYFNGNKTVKISYKKFGEDITKLSAAICERYRKKIHIGVFGKNSYEWALIYFSTLYSGNVIVPIDKDMTERGLSNIINYSQADVLFVEKEHLEKVNNIKEKLSNVKTIFSFECNTTAENDDLRQLMNEHFGKNVQLLDINPDLLAELIFTSGTTGKSQGVMLSQHNLLVNSYANNTLSTVPDNEKLLNILPMHHSFTLTCDLIRSVCIGGTVCISRGVRYLEEEMQIFKPYAIHTVPVIAKSLIINAKMRYDHCDCDEENFNLVNNFFGGHLSFILCGGAFVTQDIINTYKTMGIKLIRGYGITECSPVVSMMKTEREYDNKTIGTVLPCNEVRIKDNEIQVKGQNVMIGYYNDPEKTQNSIVDGWFSTGDIGYMEDDNLYICGRSKNIIILSNGKNVYPEEIEEFFYDNKNILEVVVFEAKRLGSEGVLAAIMHVSQNIYTNKEAIQNCVDNVNSKLPSFKKVRKYYVSDSSFDRTATNKIIRKEAIERGIRMEIENQVFGILSKMTNRSQIDLSTDTNLFMDLGLESITITELIIKCEDTFGISVDEDKIADLITVGDIVDLVINEVNYSNV